MNWVVDVSIIYNYPAVVRWAVRQISGLLSDYLEGITEQNLQAIRGDART